MSKKTKRLPPALRHGVYSGLTLLPGEDPVAFEKFHRELIAEYNPSGCSEREIVAHIARLMWRRQRLSIYQVAKLATEVHSEIYKVLKPPRADLPPHVMAQLGWKKDTRTPEQLEKLCEEADKQAQSELGSALQLVEIGNVATSDYLLDEISIIERLDGMIDRCLKRLLFVRGLKSLSSDTSARPPESPSQGLVRMGVEAK